MTAPSAVTQERFAKGMTFDQYLTFISTPENQAREGSGGAARQDMSAVLRAWYEATQLSEAQRAALGWLATQPGAPAKVLALSEDWSSDCRRDIPVLARMAEAAGWELRIFCRDGKRFGRSAQPSLAEDPDSNADIMAEFLNHKNGQLWQSIPVAVFYTDALRYLYHYTEYPAIYQKDRIRGRMFEGQPSETAEQTSERANREFLEWQRSPFFRVLASAAADEMIMALHARIQLGPA